MSRYPSLLGTSDYIADGEAIKARVLESLPQDLRLPDEYADLKSVMHVPETCGLLTQEELAITALDATGVRDAIASRQFSAVQVVKAFGRRAAIAHQLVYCLTDFFLEDAIKDAAELDRVLNETGKVVGPLHGVPISIKDHIQIKGRWGSNGFKTGIAIAAEDADMITLLRKLGAVFYVKTNQPTTIMTLECHSVYGRTLNPHNLDLSPGGSSGGESALIALRGSCMGVGTDGGGSIRAPAGHTGIYGFRPTTKTMPTDGYLFYMPGCDAFGISTGPMCNSARDIDLFMDAVRNSEPNQFDPTLYPQPWEGSNIEMKLRPPMLRAFDQVVEKLKRSHELELVDFEPYKQREGYDIVRRLYFEDGGANIRAALKEGGEGVLPLTEWLLDPEITQLHDVWQGWKVRDARDVYRKEYATRWKAAEIDVLLMPPFPGTAARHDTSRYWGYTAVYNNLDYPGIVFPTGLTADAALDRVQDRESFMSESDKYNHELYVPEIYDGAPIGLQLLAYRFDDCKLFAALRVIEKVWRS